MAYPTLRAKMRLATTTNVYDKHGIVNQQIELEAVYADGKGNETWAKATPSGRLTLMINNPAAIGKVLAGDFYVDIYPVEDWGNSVP